MYHVSFKENGYSFRVGNNSYKMICLPSENRSAPIGSKFFPFREDYFSKRALYVQGSKQEVTLFVSFIRNYEKYTIH